MKKRMVALVLAGMLLATGCGQGSKDSSQTKESSTSSESSSEDSGAVEDYKASDFVELGKYKGVEVTLTTKYSDDDDAVKEYEEDLIDSAGGLTVKDDSQTVVKEDSIVNVDYKGIKDGEAFQGGSASDVTIDVKNNQDASSGTGYIDGFTDGLIGAKVGQTVDSKVTFPEDYGASDLAGQEVTFQFTVNYICRKLTVDEVSDDFLKENFSVDSHDAFFKYAKERLQKTNAAKKSSETWSLVSDAIENNCRIKGYPAGLIDKRMSNYKKQYAAQNFSEGMTWQDFYKQYNVTEDQVDAELKEAVTSGAKQELIFNAIAEKEGMTVDSDGYQSYVKQQMQSENVSSEKDYYLMFGSSEKDGKAYVEKIYLARKALSFCVDNATVHDAE